MSKNTFVALTAADLNTSMVRGLRNEARQAGDDEMALICHNWLRHPAHDDGESPADSDATGATLTRQILAAMNDARAQA